MGKTEIDGIAIPHGGEDAFLIDTFSADTGANALFGDEIPFSHGGHMAIHGALAEIAQEKFHIVLGGTHRFVDAASFSG